MRSSLRRSAIWQRPHFLALHCGLQPNLRSSHAVIGISLAEMRERSSDDLVEGGSRQPLSTDVQNAHRFARIGISLRHSEHRLVVGSAAGSLRARATKVLIGNTTAK